MRPRVGGRSISGGFGEEIRTEHKESKMKVRRVLRNRLSFLSVVVLLSGNVVEKVVWKLMRLQQR